MDPEQKKKLTEIAASYNHDVAGEQLYRLNLTQCLIGSAVWIIGFMVLLWFPKAMEKLMSNPVVVWWFGLTMLFSIGTNIYTAHVRYKIRVRQLLHYRSLTLQMRDEE
jgi:hypothetical protein